MGIGPKIRAARIVAGMKQGELAAALSVDPVTVWRWEAGQRGVTVAMLERIAEACGTTADRILRMPVGEGDAA